MSFPQKAYTNHVKHSLQQSIPGRSLGDMLLLLANLQKPRMGGSRWCTRVIETNSRRAHLPNEFAAQPRDSIKTNQQYGKAKGLPQRYDKKSYEWRLDFKQMSKRCVTATGSREWTKEEMMACLDWSSVEDKRVEAQIAREMGNNPLANKRRGMKEFWKSAEKIAKSNKPCILRVARLNGV
jgi:hypothetical protein